MGKEVFLIIEGEYSDWSIVGYLDTLDKAEKYCHLHKEDGYYVQRAERINAEIDYNKINLKYLQEIVFDIMGDKAKMRSEQDRYKTYVGETIKTHGKVWPHNKLIYCVYVTSNNRTKAEKIAQDYMTKYLAEKNGI